MAVISASILSCDHAYIGDGIRKALAAGAGSIHVDVMDGYYVENMTFGPRLIWDIRRIAQVPVCVHLEVENPERIVPLFLDTPCDSIVFQTDACRNPIHLLEKIRQGGKRAGAAIGPAYAPEALRYILRHVDEIILMSVEPGYAGQDFEASVYEKLRELRRLMENAGRRIPVGIDGGVCAENAAKLRDAGADILICGSSVFNGEDISENLRRLLASLQT
nr:ribulose-phosphate 3-epimerase [uncultured Oscillibacter sp.]